MEKDLDDATDEDEVITEPFITVGADGKIIYPWQKSASSKKRQKQKFEIEEIEIVPLKANVKSISPTGNLTIVFNKPIILPPIRVEKPVASNTTENRTLEASDY